MIHVALKRPKSFLLTWTSEVHRCNVSLVATMSQTTTQDANNARIAQMLFADCMKAIINGNQSQFQTLLEDYTRKTQVGYDEVFHYHAQGKY